MQHGHQLALVLRKGLSREKAQVASCAACQLVCCCATASHALHSRQEACIFTATACARQQPGCTCRVATPGPSLQPPTFLPAAVDGSEDGAGRKEPCVISLAANHGFQHSDCCSTALRKAWLGGQAIRSRGSPAMPSAGTKLPSQHATKPPASMPASHPTSMPPSRQPACTHQSRCWARWTAPSSWPAPPAAPCLQHGAAAHVCLHGAPPSHAPQPACLLQCKRTVRCPACLRLSESVPCTRLVAGVAGAKGRIKSLPPAIWSG